MGLSAAAICLKEDGNQQKAGGNNIQGTCQFAG